MSRSIFISRPKVASISTRISQELSDRIQVIQTRLKAMDGDAVFPVDQIVEDALLKAVRQAESELDSCDVRSAGA